ncbi:MAG TPA: type II toxin-antitoxin system VapC family toxin [Bacteroidia bacterium]|nr:type II toxin-antitoxin system VapC family toxin [Bacteroidia bacterium]
MKLILDTHTFIWFLFGDPRLSPKAKMAIEDLNTKCYLSSASLWEIAIKESIGKLKLKLTIHRIEQLLVQNQIEILPITLEHTFQVKVLPYHHRDPFDRMLIAQSMVEGLTIVTADTEFSKYTANTLW